MQLSEEDLDGIQGLFDEYGKAWRRREAATCAGFFTLDGDLLALDGTLCRGRAEIEAYYFHQLAGPYRDFTIEDVDFAPPEVLDSDIVRVNGSWKLHGFKSQDGDVRPVQVRVSLFLKRAREGWRYASARYMVPFHGFENREP